MTGADDLLAAPVNQLGHIDMGARADAESEAGWVSESQGQEAATTASIADSFDDPLGALTQASAAATHILQCLDSSKQTSNAFLLVMPHPPRCALQPASHPLAPLESSEDDLTY